MKKVMCSRCQGRGGAVAPNRFTAGWDCPKCKGTGETNPPSKSEAETVMCLKCQGRGHGICGISFGAWTCTDCKGSGEIKLEKGYELVTVNVVCPSCDGKALSNIVINQSLHPGVSTSCRRCGGVGTIQRYAYQKIPPERKV